MNAKKYMCRCGQVYYSDHGTPMGISWNDGHTCIPRECDKGQKDWIEKWVEYERKKQ